jgi:hypothetical protein
MNNNEIIISDVLNSEEIKQIFKQYAEIQDDITYMVEEWVEIETGDDRHRIEKVELSMLWNGEFEFDIETERYHCSCCSPDYNSFTIPASLLWTDGWAQEKREEKQKANIELIRKNLAEKDKKAKEAEAAEFEHYIKLKEKYNE